MVATYGTTPGCTGEEAKHILKKKNIVMDAAYSVKMPDTWTPTFDLSNHEKVSARNDYAEKPLKKVVEEIVERKNGDRMQRNMPYFVRLVVDYFYDRMRKTKNP